MGLRSDKRALWEGEGRRNAVRRRTLVKALGENALLAAEQAARKRLDEHIRAANTNTVLGNARTKIKRFFRRMAGTGV